MQNRLTTFTEFRLKNLLQQLNPMLQNQELVINFDDRVKVSNF